MTQPTLPTKPSALINLALSDLALVEADPTYHVDMLARHDPQHSICHVCLGGCVIAKTFHWSPKVLFAWNSMDDVHNQFALVALDCFRQGLVAVGLARMGVGNPGVSDTVVVPDYAMDAAGFKAALATLASDLAKLGA